MLTLETSSPNETTNSLEPRSADRKIASSPLADRVHISPCKFSFREDNLDSLANPIAKLSRYQNPLPCNGPLLVLDRNAIPLARVRSVIVPINSWDIVFDRVATLSGRNEVGACDSSRRTRGKREGNAGVTLVRVLRLFRRFVRDFARQRKPLIR